MLTVLSVFVFTSCGDETLKYENGTLTTGKVGTAYSASVATATGGDDITYECISYLPEGLTLGTDGTLSGTPDQSRGVNRTEPSRLWQAPRAKKA